MKSKIPFLIAAIVIFAMVKTMLFLYQKSKTEPEVFSTEQPAIRDITQKAVATGAIQPRQQVEIKPRVSGVLEELFVEAGDIVTTGEKLASIKIIPNMLSLNSAEGTLRSARISFDNAKAEWVRNQELFDKQLIADTELSKFRLEFLLRQQEVKAAQSNLQLIKSGVSGGNKISNIVSSTVDGMVIEVPPKRGASVTEANNFNPGTTIASVANMNDIIFEGAVDESEVGKIKVGMSLDLVIGAIDNQHFEGTLEYIAPKGSMIDGAIQFQVRASLKLSSDDFIRAGYSATADIVLDRRTQVLSISEALLRFNDKKEPYVEIESAPATYEKRSIKIGLSDGIYVEVLEGLTASDQIKALSAAQTKEKS